MNNFTRFVRAASYFFILCTLFYSANSNARIYKWTDENGQVQYTQTPPPQNIEKVKELNVGKSKSGSTGGQAGDAKYCQALRDFSLNVAKAMKNGVPSSEVRSSIHAADEQLREVLDTNDALLTQVLYYIYGFKHADMSSVQIANLVYKQCRGGSYGGALVKKGGNGTSNHGASSGTGWPIAQGYVVTNYHVINEREKITVRTVSGNTINAQLFKADKNNDIALLKVDDPGKLPKALPLSSQQAKLGARVFTIGYPHPDLMGSKPKLTSGTISSLWGMRDDPRTYQISVPVQAGNSGGPLINMDGNVVGIVTSKLSAVKIFDWTGDLPQNVNYAMKTQYLQNLLRQVQSQKLPVKEHHSRTGELSDLATQFQDSILLIMAK